LNKIGKAVTEGQYGTNKIHHNEKKHRTTTAVQRKQCILSIAKIT